MALAARGVTGAATWLGRVASTVGRRVGGSGNPAGLASAQLDNTPLRAHDDEEPVPTSTAPFLVPAGFAICTESGVSVPKEVMLPMLKGYDWDKATMHLQGTTEQAEVHAVKQRLAEGYDIPHEEAVAIFNKLKAWHYSGHFTELIESVKTQSGDGRGVIAAMLTEMETSMEELVQTKTEVAAMISEQRYAEA